MRLPATAWILVTLLREAIRALAFPLRLLCYLPRQRYWKARARLALSVAPSDDGGGQLEGFLAKGGAPRNGAGHVFISAGEASGEIHATNVMRALAKTNGNGPAVRWSCFGGQSMEQAGGRLLFPLSEHAIMGLAGVLRSLPFLIRAVWRYLRMLRTDPPDLVVLVDYPGLHLVLGRLARHHGVAVLHYIAPQYWAWAPWRLERYRGCVDATLTILPFEPGFYAQVGLPSAYVGHPLLDHLAAQPPDSAAVDAVRERPTVCLLPGSRRTEIAANIPAFVRIARNLRADHPELRFVMPHTDPRRTALIEQALAEEKADFIEFHHGPLATWLLGSRVVLAKSGTGSLEACMQGTPTVVVYKIKGAFAEWGYRNCVTVPWVAAANLIAGRAIVPELIFRGTEGWERAESELRRLLADGATREACLNNLAEVQQRLGEPGASARAAGWIEAFLTPR